VGGAIAVGLLLSGCTSTPAVIEPTDAPVGDQQGSTGAPGLPDFCDQLVPPLTVASVFERELGGGRSAEYDAPQPVNGLVAGMTCGHGVQGKEAALTTVGRDHTDETAARAEIQELSQKLTADATAGAEESVPVAGLPGFVVDTASSSTCFVRDGTRTVAVTLRSGVVGSADARDALLRIASAVVEGLPRS
jgi:hypothetical protein